MPREGATEPLRLDRGSGARARDDSRQPFRGHERDRGASGRAGASQAALVDSGGRSPRRLCWRSGSSAGVCVSATTSGRTRSPAPASRGSPTGKAPSSMRHLARRQVRGLSLRPRRAVRRLGRPGGQRRVPESHQGPGTRASPTPIVRNVGFSDDGAHVWFRVELAGRKAGTASGSCRRSAGRRGLPAERRRGGLVARPTAASSITRRIPGDPIFIADRNGGNPRQIFVDKPGIHNHYVDLVAGRPLRLFRPGDTARRHGHLAGPLGGRGRRAPDPSQFARRLSRVCSTTAR